MPLSRLLLAFEPHDRHLFFGREEVVGDVLARIAPGRLLAVVGASGSGKSSLLRAGVLAAVEAGELAHARCARLITPGAEPPLDLEDDESQLLVVDQFEELYTQCRDAVRRARFIDALLSRSGPVVIGLRSGQVRDLAPGESSDGCAATTPSFTPDSRLMAVVDGCIHVVVWDLESGRVKRTTVLPDRASGSGALLSPDGRYVLVAVLGGAFVRIDLASGGVVARPGAQTEGNVLAISPDGHFYAIGRQDGTVDEYDARSLQLVRHHSLDNAIQTLAFSPDSRELAVEDTRNVVRVWDTCAVCENPTRLAQLAARQSVRELTPGERASFGVS